ncbi:hypothetical protein [Bounagaea algeriensis]
MLAAAPNAQRCAQPLVDPCDGPRLAGSSAPSSADGSVGQVTESGALTDLLLQLLVDLLRHLSLLTACFAPTEKLKLHPLAPPASVSIASTVAAR